MCTVDHSILLPFFNVETKKFYNLLSILLLYHQHHDPHLGYNFIIFDVFKGVMWVGECVEWAEEKDLAKSFREEPDSTCRAQQPLDC